MRKERPAAYTYSAILHAILALLILVGMPELFTAKKEPEPMAITVDLVPIGAITNIKPSDTPPTPKPKPEDQKAQAKKAISEVKKAAPAPEEKKPDPVPEPKKEETKPDPKPEPKKEEPKPEEKKPEPKKQEKPKEKKKEDDISSILDAVKEQAKKDQADKPDKKKETSSTAKSDVPYDPNLKISQTVKDSINSQFLKCWSIDPGRKGAENLLVEVEMWRNSDGTLRGEPKLTAKSLARMGDPAFAAAASAALRAVKKPDCNPLKGLPPESYQGWSWMIFTFNPADLM